MTWLLGSNVNPSRRITENAAGDLRAIRASSFYSGTCASRRQSASERSQQMVGTDWLKNTSRPVSEPSASPDGRRMSFGDTSVAYRA